MIQETLREAHLAIINYCLRFNYPLKRWNNIVNVMIRKDAENSHLHRLRVLHLYEADFQLLTGVIWKKSLHQAETNNLLHKDTYGSRPRRNAHMPVQIEEMQYEISRLTRYPLIRYDNDASNCFDRIVPSVGMLASQKYGVN